MHWVGLCLPATVLLSWHFCSIFGGGLIPELSPSLNFKLPESKDFPTPLPPPPLFVSAPASQRSSWYRVGIRDTMMVGIQK